MKLLIVFATPAEAAGLCNFLGLRQLPEGEIIHKDYKSIQVSLLCSGVGMIRTTFHLSRILVSKRFDLAINIGVCGSFQRSVMLGEVVNVKSDFFSEFGAEDGEEWLSAFAMGLEDANRNPYKDGKLIATGLQKVKSVRHLEQVSGITVNRVHGNEESINRVTSEFHPDIESMEGAAFLFSCLCENIACLQIRSVSNYVEKRNKDNWEMNLAIENLNNYIVEMLEEIPHP